MNYFLAGKLPGLIIVFFAIIIFYLNLLIISNIINMKKFIMMAMILLLPFTANAERRTQGSGPNIYTECGIGGMLFNSDPNSRSQLSDFLAVTSNVVWDVGLTATTSAIASPHLCVPKKEEVAKLILETLPELEKDFATGQGQYITALSATLGCQENVINAKLRESYSDIIISDAYHTKSKIDRASDMYNMVDKVSSVDCAL